MPIYEYVCQKCGHKTEVIQSHSAKPPKKCPDCGGALKKAFSAPAIQFKGSGFYITDYGKGGAGPSTGSDRAEKGEKSDSSASAATSSDKVEKGESKSDKGDKGDKGEKAARPGGEAAKSDGAKKGEAKKKNSR